MRFTTTLLIAGFAALAGPSPTLAKHVSHAKAKHAWRKPPVVRDCTPVNGRYGYYGNPWCDTGSSRPPDIQFRETHRQQKR